MNCPECQKEMYQQGMDRTPLNSFKINSITPETIIFVVTKIYKCNACDIKAEKNSYTTYKQEI